MATTPSTTTDLEVFADAPAPPPVRPRTLLVGTTMAGVACAASLFGLIALYAQERTESLANDGSWLPEDSIIPLTPGTMGMATLLMSLVTAAWAVYALRNDDRPHAYLALATTLLFGVAFVVDTAYLWQQMNLGIRDSLAAVLIYAITGGHVAMTVGGMLFLAVMGFRALGGQLTGRQAEGMYAAVLFWLITIGVYSVVWYAIYITK
jgi:heme/copper-type cytochrome/quinol oxidase subunit 3